MVEYEVKCFRRYGVFDFHVLWLRARLHQASVSTQSQRWDDAHDTTLIEINGVTPKWVATLFWSDSICFH